MWHQETLRTGGIGRNEVRPPVLHVVVYIPCSKKSICIVTQYFRGFTVVWKRNYQVYYIIRIAAVSQEHVLVCITRKISKTAWFWCWHGNWLCCVGGRNRGDFSVRDRGWNDFSVGIRIDLVSCAGRKLLVFGASMEIDLVFGILVEIDLYLSVWGIELDLISV